MKNWKKISISVIALLLAAVMAAGMANPCAAMAKGKKKGRTAVIYFSVTGTTKGAAKKIKKATGGKLLAIKAAEPYTDADVDYDDEESRAAKEHASSESPAAGGARPAIANLSAIKKAVKAADVVYIGYPIWWGEAPHIMYSLVENVSFNGKTIVPFCTSASSGMGKSAKNLMGNAKPSTDAEWLKGRNFYGVPSQKKVNAWIKSLKF